LSPYHASIKVRDNSTGVESNLIDIGYGASQVIPVIMACLTRSVGPLVIEQPELHLHPKAQGTLAEIILEVSKNRQLFIETHSVHIINRARIMLAEGRLRPEDIVILFIGKDQHGSCFNTIRMNSKGDFVNEWPEEYGFFDERYHDTMRLLGI